MKSPIPAALLALALSAPSFGNDMSAAPYTPTWESLNARPAPEWYLDAKFGIFIHWGVYSVPAWAKLGEYSEWYWHHLNAPDPLTPEQQEIRKAISEFHSQTYGKHFRYQDFAPYFKAELFDAKHWADVFARSGAKYVVPTSKHHDGFALWPSREANQTWGRPWNAVDVGPRRDLMGELAEATREAGLKFGFYYSLYEWFNPLWLADRNAYVNDHMIPQFKDVVTRYAPALIFSDGEWDMPAENWKSAELLAWLYNESPSKDEVIVNDRWGKGSRHRNGGYWTTEYTAGMQDGSHPWEESRGIAASYGLNRAERAEHYMSSRELILVLADLVSRGGNLLLDIGPAADGTIPPLMEQRLLEIGDWLRVNGEAIYGTRTAGRSAQWTEGTRPDQEYGEYKVKYNLLEQVGQAPRDGVAAKQVFFTKKPEALYAITAGWPGEKLVLRDMEIPAGAKVSLLGVPGSLKSSHSRGTLTIETPRLAPGQEPCQHAFTFKIEGANVRPEPKPTPTPTTTPTAAAPSP